MRKILVTSALPYANGSIHLGHLVEYIQTDIWVRMQKMLGNTCHYVCADDAHGTPIMLKAEETGITPEILIDEVSKEHQSDFAEFFIGFDNYHSTHSEENKTIAIDIYTKLKTSGYIQQRTISQAFDSEKKMFLPDRFIKGSCPKCKSADQYGDSCEVCGATYTPTDLLAPKSVVSGTTPVTKDTEHLFFDLPQFSNMLQSWLKAGHLQSEVAKKLSEWFETGLKAWDISRDAPYFGFQIPDFDDKYFYVWLDAPIGYMASFKNLCAKKNLNFDEFWAENNNTELVHFIGKDIIYFHALFWPAILSGSGYRTPTFVFAHGFLTVNGQKMSKSRGTFIKARTYLKYLNPEALRYYFAAKLGNGIDDIDLNLNDFKQRVNADLVGKVINIASRCSGFIHKNYNATLSPTMPRMDLYQSFLDARKEIFDLYEARKTGHAIRKIMELADLANQYIDQQKPWVLVKQEKNAQAVQDICSVGLNLFRVLMCYLTPVIPDMAQRTRDFLDEALSLNAIQTPLENHKINKFKPLMYRIENEFIEKMIEDTKTELDQSKTIKTEEL